MKSLTKKEDDTLFDRIWRFYYDSKSQTELTATEEKMRERWEFAWRMMCGINTKRQVAKMMAKRYSVSERTAWTDIANAKMLFGSDPKVANKQAERELVSQWIMKGIRKAWDDKDMDNYYKLLSSYTKLHGLEDHKDLGLGDIISKLKPHVIEISADPETLKQQAAGLMEDVEDVDYEDLKSDDEKQG